MATKLGIVNAALLKLGARTISALTDTSKSARLANETFDSLRDVVLHGHHWNFAMDRTSLVADSATPEWGYDFQYLLPDDCLKVVEVNGQHPSSGVWKVEGRNVLTDLTGPLEILFVSRVDDYGDYPALFSDALSAKCAAEWCQRLTGTDSTQKIHDILYRQKIAEAKAVDGQEGTPNKIKAGAWLESRWGGRPGF